MTDYRGGSLAESKILALEKQREAEKKARKAEMDRIAEEGRKPKVPCAREANQTKRRIKDGSSHYLFFPLPF